MPDSFRFNLFALILGFRQFPQSPAFTNVKFLPLKAGKEIPPFLIIPIARRFDSNKLSDELAKAINEADGKARVYVAEGKTHCSLNGDIGQSGDKPTAEIMTFIQKQMDQ